VTERRRFAAMIVLFLIGFGLIGLASTVNSTWPLFVTVIPYAAIPCPLRKARNAEGRLSAPFVRRGDGI